MSSSTYKFTIVNGTVTAMFELDDGIWRSESIDSDETVSYNAATGAVTVTESYGTFREVKVYQPIAGTATWAEADEYYTDLLGNVIQEQPKDSSWNDSNSDGFDDDDIDQDGFENDDIRGSSGDDSVNGAAGDDSVSGNDGDDSLNGGLGDDSLDGDLGDDSLLGGSGNDDLVGGDGRDSLSGGNGSDDLLGGAGDDSIVGGIGDDNVWGGSGNDHVSAGGGSDDVFGGAGNDVIEAGDDAGNDHYAGGLGIDTVRFTGADASVVVNLGTGTATSMGVGDLAVIGSNTLTGIEDVVGGGWDDRLSGNSGANRLDGGRGDDSIGGGLGNDSITGGLGDDSIGGGLGNDSITGGLGSDLLNGGADSVRDVFDFNSVLDSRVGAGSDRVLNFKSTTDDLDLRTIDADSALAGNQAFEFGGTTATAHGVWQAHSGTSTLVFGDVNGDAVADFAITLVGCNGVVAGDILF